MEGASDLGCDCEWQQLDDLAHKLANANEVELCWLLRGMNDSAANTTSGLTDVPPGYKAYYVAGANSVNHGDVVTEVLARQTMATHFGI